MFFHHNNVCLAALTCQDLIREAFAGDNVVEEEFEAAKAALVDTETVKDKDITLPGWGAWGGVGADTTKQK